MAGRKKSEQTGKYAGTHASTGLTRRGEVDVQKLLRDYTGTSNTLGWFRKNKPELFSEARAMYLDGANKKSEELWPIVNKDAKRLADCSNLPVKDVTASMRMARLWLFMGKKRMEYPRVLQNILEQFADCSGDDVGTILLGYPQNSTIPTTGGMASA